MEEKEASQKSFYFSVHGDGKDIGNMKVYGDKIYDATDEKNMFGATIYQQRDNHDESIEYWEPIKAWAWKPRTALGTSKCGAQDVKSRKRAHPDIKAVTEVEFATGKPKPDNWSDPFEVTITPIAPPASPQPPLPSSADVELFWMMCEAILQFPALAKADGLIKSKDDLMAVLVKKPQLADKAMMTKTLSASDWFDLFTATASEKKRKREE
jgi:hypothetical protein